MKKRKAAGRKTVKKKPALTAKPLRDLGGTLGWFQSIESLANSSVDFCGWEGSGNAPIFRERNAVDGVPLPIDLEPAVKAFARRAAAASIGRLSDPPIINESGEEAFSPVSLDTIHAFYVEDSARTMVRLGFYLAIMRYAEELKHVPQAAALLEAKRRGAKKGGDARRKQAAPNHKAIRRRFKALRKTTPKKTVRYLRVAEEFGMSDRHVARIVDGID